MAYDRLLVLALVAGCTVGGRGPDPVTARPPPDPDGMPTEVLDHQDPAADTSENPVLSRSESHYVHPDVAGWMDWFGCLRLFSCSTTDGGRADWSGIAIVLAALATTRRRRRS